MTAPRLHDRGMIAWMARHRVAPNILMAVLLVGGLFMITQIRQEVWPPFEPDTVSISVALPGATPEEVEQSVVLVIEEALGGVEGIASLSGTAGEGSGSVLAEIDPSADRQQTYDAIRQAIDRVTTFPVDAEEPDVSLSTRRREVVELQLYGDADEQSLRYAAEQVRDALLQADGISQVELSGVRDFEISVELSQGALRAQGLTLAGVADLVRRAALDRAGGTLDTEGGAILVRVSDRRDWAREFRELPVVTDASGVLLRLGDVAEVRETFEDSTVAATYNGLPAVRIDVFRTGDETPISVSDAVKAALPAAMATLPEAIRIATVDDDADIYRDRLYLLVGNGAQGLVIVLVVLALFLEPRLAFWVALGIPVAFLGTFLFLPLLGISLNMISMFAFIVAAGIVVDEEIITGENIHEYRKRGLAPLDASIQGTRDLAVPIAFSVLTNIVGFMPLAMIPGTFGQFWVVVPVLVSICFLISWLGALYILPSHLAGIRDTAPRSRLGRAQRACSDALDRFGARGFGPLLRLALHWRYVTLALMVGLLVLAVAWPLSGRMGFSTFPQVQRDFARVFVTLPVDAPESRILAARDHYVAAAEQVVAENGGEALGTGISALVEGTRVEVRIYLRPQGERPIDTSEVTRLWREAAGDLAGLRAARFESSFGGPGGGQGLTVELSHTDVDALEGAAADLARRLAAFTALSDIEDGFVPGKVQLEFRLTEAGRALGLTADEVARQVRAAFLGVEAMRQQRGRNEVTVRVRLPEGERASEADIENLILAVPGGGEAALYEVASVERSRAPSAISREDGRRVVTVTANVTPEEETLLVVERLRDEVLPALRADHPGLATAFGGRQEQQDEVFGSFGPSIGLALLGIYVLLAIPLRSYVQPLIVMTAIPFGVVGAVLGHLVMGFSLSLNSVLGAIALGGVVINAALVMLDYANDARAAGAAPFEAIWRAGVRRFRPILLTTMTTFGGLAPMIFETSRQAQFLIPMAISLGYGIVFATVIVLFFVPALYLAIEDVRRLANPARRPGPQSGPEGGQALPAPGRVAAE